MVTWAEIKAECGSYRDGFVAVFRRYEGQETDERDARGLVVRVTQTSFARHAGIPDATFRHWVKAADGVIQTVSKSKQDKFSRRNVRLGLRHASQPARVKILRELVREDPDIRRATVEALDEVAQHVEEPPPPPSPREPEPEPDPAEERQRRTREAADQLRHATSALGRAVELLEGLDLGRDILAVETTTWETCLNDARNYLDVLRDAYEGRTVSGEADAWLRQQGN